MIELTEQEARLIVGFLDELGNKQGNAGCNDWRWPEFMTQEDRDVFMRVHINRMEDLDERAMYEDDFPQSEWTSDFIVVGELEERLLDQLSENGIEL